MEKLGDNVVPMIGNVVTEDDETLLEDNLAPTVRKINVDDIEKGKVHMPFTQRAGWLKVQQDDRTHQQLAWLIDTSQSPEKRKTKGDNTNLKLLHNLYRNGHLKKAADGFITITHSDTNKGESMAISVPSIMYPGLIQALHLKLNHPSKLQLERLSNRYFYTPGHARIVAEVTDNCNVCASLKQLPAEIFSESSIENKTFGAHFSADVIQRDGQKVLLCREKLSQFTTTVFISDQTANSMRDALISSVIETIPANGTTVQVDCATSLQTLQKEYEEDDSILKRLGIKIDLGRTLNKNKNPVAENAVKEFHKERLRLNPAGGPISEIDRALITKNMNSRIRDRGLSSKEIAFQRDQISNDTKPVSDEEMSSKQYQNRKQNYP